MSGKSEDRKPWYGTANGDEVSNKKAHGPRVTRAALPDGSTIVGLSMSALDAKRFVKACHEHYPEFEVDETIVLE